MIDPTLLSLAASVAENERQRGRHVTMPARPRTVLIVDGEAPVREVIDDILQLHGYATLQAATGDEAVSLCRGNARPIDLIIADLNIPGPTGHALEDRIVATRRGMKVMFMSGYPDELVRRHGLLPGGREFLKKPFSLDELVGKVREVLE
jgi:DNA-binding response OmpR family regulator